MRRSAKSGVAVLEFTLSSLVLVPLVLGTGVMGVNLIRNLGTIQLARDVGHMYANTGTSFYMTGFTTIMASLGGDLGMSATAGQGNVVIILSQLKYVDTADCTAVGAVDTNGNPTSACTNYTKWVFVQRLVRGNSSVRTSNLGSPLVSGPTGVTVNSTTGVISQSDYTKKAGAVAIFSGVNPYSVVNSIAQGLPTNQVLYVAEAAATGMRMPPFSSGAAVYSWGMF